MKPLSKAWLEAYLCGDEVDDLEPVTVRLMVTKQHGFELDADLEIASVDLALVHPAFPEPAGLGWSDLAHWHSHVLRTGEVARLSQGVTLEPGVKHPQATAFVLLSLFALPTSEDLEQHVAQLTTALETLGLTPTEVAALRARAFHPHVFHALQGTAWLEHDGVWVVDGIDAYSARRAENDTFPHAQLRETLARAHQGSV